MPRNRRLYSTSGYSHIVARGIGQQILFETVRDYQVYLTHLQKHADEAHIVLCAYCLMDNHIHLLVYDPEQTLSSFMQKVGTSYSQYYNKKYQRSGHLFQNRYHNEPIETNNSFLNVVRYILQNPEKAGICRAEEYGWSSYSAFWHQDSFVDTTLLRQSFSTEDAYIRFIREHTFAERTFLDGVPRRSDEYIRNILQQCLGIESGTALQSYDRQRRNKAIQILKANGLSEREIARLTGFSRAVIRKL